MPSQFSSDGERANLPRPRPSIDSTAEPFVGNETVDDNLGEAVRIALWNLTKGTHHAVDVSVANGVVTLRGDVEAGPQRTAIEAAITRIAGVRAVVNALEITGARPVAPRVGAKGAPRIDVIESRPFLYLVRYCGFTEASLSAAIREAVSKLDAFYASHGLDLPDALFVLYRNQHADMVTLDIGMPVGADIVPQDEFHLGSTPGGPTISAPVAGGLESLRRNSVALASKARAARLGPANYFWQRFEGEAFRGWHGHPDGAVFLPVSASLGETSGSPT